MAKTKRIPLTKPEKEVVAAMEATVAEQVNKLDPIGLLAIDGMPPDEYTREIRDITLALWMAGDDCSILAEVMYVVFAYYFSIDDAGPRSKYAVAAFEIMLKLKEWKDGLSGKKISSDISEI